MALSKRTKTWIERLVSSEAAERRKAAEKLLGLAENHFDRKGPDQAERAQILATLVPCLSDDTVVREAVAFLVGSLRGWTKESASLLERLLDDDAPAVRIMSIWALGRIGSPAKSLANQLLPMARDEHGEIRWRVPWAVAAMEASGPAVSQCLLELLADEDETVRYHALDAIGPATVIGGMAREDAVLAMLSDPAAAVRGAACRALLRLGDARRSTQAALEALLQDQAHGVTLEAVHTLCQLDDGAHERPAIRSWLEDNRGYWWVDELLGENDDDEG